MDSISRAKTRRNAELYSSILSLIIFSILRDCLRFSRNAIFIETGENVVDVCWTLVVVQRQSGATRFMPW